MWVDKRSNTVLKTYNKDDTLGWTNNLRYTTENTAKKIGVSTYFIKHQVMMA